MPFRLKHKKTSPSGEAACSLKDFTDCTPAVPVSYNAAIQPLFPLGYPIFGYSDSSLSDIVLVPKNTFVQHNYTHCLRLRNRLLRLFAFRQRVLYIIQVCLSNIFFYTPSVRRPVIELPDDPVGLEGVHKCLGIDLLDRIGDTAGLGA